MSLLVTRTVVRIKSAAVVVNGKQESLTFATPGNHDGSCLAVAHGVDRKLAHDAQDRMGGRVGDPLAWDGEPNCEVDARYVRCQCPLDGGFHIVCVKSLMAHVPEAVP